MKTVKAWIFDAFSWGLGAWDWADYRLLSTTDYRLPTSWISGAFLLPLATEATIAFRIANAKVDGTL